MDAANPTRLQMTEVLDEQIRCLKRMLATLATEDRALREGDPVGLNAASADKARLVEALETLEAERNGLAAILDPRTGGEGAGDPNSQWQELLNLLEQCRRQNQRNGAVVDAQRRQVLAALKLLRGAPPELYDSRGMERAGLNAQRLGTA